MSGQRFEHVAEGYVHDVAVLEAYARLGGHGKVPKTADRVLQGEVGPAEGQIVVWYTRAMGGGVFDGKVCCSVGGGKYE